MYDGRRSLLQSFNRHTILDRHIVPFTSSNVDLSGKLQAIAGNNGDGNRRKRSADTINSTGSLQLKIRHALPVWAAKS
jgi:hypothetical protein